MNQINYHMVKILLLVFIMIWCTDISAYDIVVKGIYYNVDVTKKTATVTYKTRGSDVSCYEGNIVIPESIEYNTQKLKVTSIGELAFFRSQMQSISMPNSIKTIGQSAFAYCKSLTSVILPDSITHISASVLYQCKKLKSISIPEGVKTIDDRAFCGCSELESVNIPVGIQTIGYGAFSDCTNLERLEIPHTVKQIAASSFSRGIKNVIIKDGDTPIDILIGAILSNSIESVQNIFIGRSSNFIDYTGKNSWLTLSCKSLSFGEMVGEITGNINFYADEIKSFVKDPNNFQVSFPNDVYINAILYVPKGLKLLYETASGWNQFFNIQEFEDGNSSISVIDNTCSSSKYLYSFDGKIYGSKAVGIIFKTPFGKAKKIIYNK